MRKGRPARKTFLRILGKTLISLALYLVMLLLYIWPVRGHFELRIRGMNTNTEAMISWKELQHTLNQYPIFRMPWSGDIKEMTYTIPGLKRTRTFRVDLSTDRWAIWELAERIADREKEKPLEQQDFQEILQEFLMNDFSEKQGRPITTCTSMTPQGVCVAEEYLLISAYCHTHRHNSVLYVIDRETHEFVKEVVLQGRSHVGAIAFDPEYANVWVTSYDEENMRAYVNSVSLESIRLYDLDRDRKPLPFTQFYPIVTQKSASFMTYRDRALYVGYFTNKRGMESTIQKFEMNEGGGLVTYDNGEDLSWSLFHSVPMPSEMIAVSNKCQGMTFNDGYVLISQSFGALTSHIRGYRDTVEDGALDARNEKAVFELELPPMLEQISFDAEGRLYMIFESPAAAYRLWPARQVDRVVVLGVGTAENLLNITG